MLKDLSFQVKLNQNMKQYHSHIDILEGRAGIRSLREDRVMTDPQNLIQVEVA